MKTAVVETFFIKLKAYPRKFLAKQSFTSETMQNRVTSFGNSKIKSQVGHSKMFLNVTISHFFHHTVSSPCHQANSDKVFPWSKTFLGRTPQEATSQEELHKGSFLLNFMNFFRIAFQQNSSEWLLPKFREIREHWCFFFFLKLRFTPCKAEQPLRGMELQEKKSTKNITGYRKSV